MSTKQIAWRMFFGACAYFLIALVYAIIAGADGLLINAGIVWFVTLGTLVASYWFERE